MWRFVFSAVLLACALGALFYSQRQDSDFYVSGLIEADEVRLGSRVGGRVLEVRVAEGEQVKSGQVLIVLDPYALRERLAQAEADLAAQDARLRQLTAGYRVEEIAQARAVRDRHQASLDRAVAGKRPLELAILRDIVAAAEAEARNAEREFNRVKLLRERGEATQDEADNALFERDAANARLAAAQDELQLAEEGTRAEEIAEARALLEQAQANLDMMERGYRAEEIAAARAQVESARATVATVQRQIDELTIASPLDGLVEALDLQPGDLIAPDAPVISILDPRELRVRAYLPENRIDVAVGRAVVVRVDSYPGRDFAGRITFVARHAEFMPANVQTPEKRVKQMFRFKVTVEGGLGELRPGMSADVHLEAPR